MELRDLRHFELRELYYFVAVAEELHFARAAERVGIHQSPLSKAITLMERHLGVRLFVRDRRCTQLTPIGEALLNDARRILADAEHAHQGIIAAAAGRTGRVRIALADGLAHPRVAALLRRTYGQESGIDVHVIHGSLSEQLRLLRSNLLDVGLAATAPDFRALAMSNQTDSVVPTISFGDDIHATPLWRDSLSVILDRAHAAAAAAKAEIDWDVLAKEKLITIGEKPPAFDAGGTLIEVNGSPRNRITYVASVELLLTLVAAGKGAGLVGSALAETVHRDDLAVRPLSTRRPKITTLLLRRSDDDSPLVGRFFDRAQKAS
jgi:DNA-binding transcriptional LysR family regulator